MTEPKNYERSPLAWEVAFRGSPLYPILENAFGGAALVEPASGRVLYLNPMFREWLRIPSQADLPPTVMELFDLGNADTGEFLDQLKNAASNKSSVATFAARLMVGDLRFKPVTLRMCRVQFDDQPLVAVLAQDELPTSSRLPRADTECRDSLTGLLDRAFLLPRLRTLMAGERAADRQFAVLFVDLNNFKQVNDAHGHLIGDQVLREVAQRLSGCVRGDDQIVRFGGDEFVVLVENVSSLTDIEPIVERIHAVLAEPISVPDGEFALSVSVGTAIALPEHQSPEDVLDAADRAMYAEKRASGKPA